jgi:methionine sulfoxide reductase heme-binding subunit
MVSSSVSDVRPGTGAGRGSRRRVRALRSAAVVAVLGVASVVPFYVVIYHLQAADRSAAALGMASMHMDRIDVYWSFPILQASGIAALIWAYLGVLLGLAVSTPAGSWWPLSRATTNRLHRQLSLLVIGLILVHALATAYDAMGDNLLTAFVPWQESWTAAVFAYNLGIFALYLAVLVGPTYYLRRRVGAVRWRFVHRAAVVVYLLSVWHTLLLGLDFSHYAWVRPVTWLAQLPLLALFAVRLRAPARRVRYRGVDTLAWLATARDGLIVLSAVAAVAIVALVATGHAGLPARVGSAGGPVAGLGVDWLPAWLRVIAVAGFAAVAVVHLWHLAGGDARSRWWHGGHALMALGMIDMFLPGGALPVSPRVGEAVFGVAALAAVAVAVTGRVRDRRAGTLWVTLAADLAGMGYMFAMPANGFTWLSLLLVAWLVVQATGWATGGLTTVKAHGGLGGGPGALATDPPAEPVPSTVDVTRHGWWLRVTLAAMTAGMAYMVVAMQFGMGVGTGAPGGMPPMPGM